MIKSRSVSFKPYSHECFFFQSRLESNCCKIWRHTLLNRGYVIGHFHLNPTQVAIPNERQRYYCVAVLSDNLVGRANPFVDKFERLSANFPETPPASKLYSDLPLPQIMKSIPSLGVQEDGTFCLAPIVSFLDKDLPPLASESSINYTKLEALRVPKRLFDSDAAWCFDIISIPNNNEDAVDNNSSSRSLSCFTHSYGKFARGAGSILCMQRDKKISLEKPENRQFDKKWKQEIQRENLRYFSGSEVARFMGLTVDTDQCDKSKTTFDFPPGCEIKSQWRLLGNSLNVEVASRVVEAGLRILLNKCTNEHILAS